MVKKQRFKVTFLQLGNSDNCYQFVIISPTTSEITSIFLHSFLLHNINGLR